MNNSCKLYLIIAAIGSMSNAVCMEEKELQPSFISEALNQESVQNLRKIYTEILGIPEDASFNDVADAYNAILKTADTNKKNQAKIAYDALVNLICKEDAEPYLQNMDDFSYENQQLLRQQEELRMLMNKVFTYVPGKTQPVPTQVMPVMPVAPQSIQPVFPQHMGVQKTSLNGSRSKVTVALRSHTFIRRVKSKPSPAPYQNSNTGSGSDL